MLFLHDVASSFRVEHRFEKIQSHRSFSCPHLTHKIKDRKADGAKFLKIGVVVESRDLDEYSGLQRDLVYVVLLKHQLYIVEIYD